MTSEPERHERRRWARRHATHARRARRPRRAGSSRRRGATTTPVGSASPTPPPTPGSGCGTAASTPSCGPTSATSERRVSCGARSSAQDADGFVPHLRYGAGPQPHAALWGRAGASTITQPPMYGHAAAALTRLGFEVDGDELLDRATSGLRFLLQRRRRTAGGPGGDLPPMGVGLRRQPSLGRRRPRRVDTRTRGSICKGALVASIERSASGAPLHNPAFAVGSVGFSALVAWNALELAEVTGDDELRRQAGELADADRRPMGRRAGHLGGRWSDGRGVRPRPHPGRPAAAAGAPSPRGRRDADGSRRVRRAAVGPRGVHRDEPTFAPTTYWRGPAWPQLTYLLWLATSSVYDRTAAASLSRSMVTGTRRVVVRGVLGGRHRPGARRRAPDLVDPHRRAPRP